MKLNKDRFGIDKIFYLLAEESFRNISASKARRAAIDFDFQTLSECVPPAIITQLLEKAMRIKNLFMVVGKPASGKSSFLKMLTAIDKDIVHIDTDLFSKTFRPLLLEKFGQDADLIGLAIDRECEMTAFLVPFWFASLAEALRKVPKDSHVFLEIPYGLKNGKELYRYIGNKIIYVGCNDQAENRRRIEHRNTDHHARFIQEIPGLSESLSIAKKFRLDLQIIDSSGTIDDLRRSVEKFVKTVYKKEGH